MSASRRLRVGVPADLLELRAVGGHGKVWHRVLAGLSRVVEVTPIGTARRPARRVLSRRPGVILADGHADLPPVRAPLVVQVHEAGWFEPSLRAVLDPEFLEYISTRTELAVRRATRVITPSESARRDLISAYQLDPSIVHAVHHGVDDTFRPGLPGGRALVARFRSGGQAPYVLYAATLHPRKNLDLLREAMGRLAAEGLPHVLVIAGHPAPDRPDSSSLQRRATAELPGAPGRVVGLGAPDDHDLAALMAGADAFCLPSLYEGFGLTALEAMACGTPVVVSDRGALPEVVGDGGLIVEPTVDALSSALRGILGDRERAAALGRAGASRASQYSWERTAAGWLSVLRTAAASS